MKADLEAKGVKPSLMTPVPMCISLDRVEEFKRSHKAKENTGNVTLLYLGTLARARKLDFLVRVLRLVKQKRKDVTLLFVGAGNVPEDEGMLLAEAKKFGLEDSVHITGFLPWEEAWQLVLDSDICLSPYYPTPILNSTSPTKLIEYLALEKPVVANDHPDQRNVIESSSAGICVPWEEQAFADAIISLLENPEMAQGMASNGFSYVRDNRSYEFMGKFLADIYTELLAKK
jgi:glycosyltransferase involved in cell wall biosynthesis